jgi:hypothetical protein
VCGEYVCVHVSMCECIKERRWCECVKEKEKDALVEEDRGLTVAAVGRARNERLHNGYAAIAKRLPGKRSQCKSLQSDQAKMTSSECKAISNRSRSDWTAIA